MDSEPDLDDRKFKFVLPSLTRTEVSERVGKFFNSTRWVLLAGCILLFIWGCFILGLGIIAQVKQAHVDSLYIPGIEILPPLIIVLGILGCIVTILGAVGAYLYNRKLLISFTVIMAVLILFQCCIGVAAIVSLAEVPKVTNAAWDYSSNRTREKMQSEFECCGFHNATDRSYLPSCTPGGLTRGCEESVVHLFKTSLITIIVTVFLFTFFQFLTIAATVALTIRVRAVQLRYAKLNQDDPVSLIY